MGRDDDFWDLVERGKRRLGWDEPLPEPPKPLRPERPPQFPPRRSPPSGPQEPARPKPPPDDPFWRRVEASQAWRGEAGLKREPTPEPLISTGDPEIDRLIAVVAALPTPPPPDFRQQLVDRERSWHEKAVAKYEREKAEAEAPDLYEDWEPEWQEPTFTDEDLAAIWRYEPIYQIWMLTEADWSRGAAALKGLVQVIEHPEARMRRDVEKAFFHVLEKASYYSSKGVPDSHIPPDLWFRIKQGGANNQVVRYLARPLQQVLEAPGKEFGVSTWRMASRIIGKEIVDFVGDYFDDGWWPVWNFRNWEDLEDFEWRVNRGLRQSIGSERDNSIGVKYGMYDTPEVMTLFRYVKDEARGWVLHPAAADEERGSLGHPPFVDAKHVALDCGWAVRQFLGLSGWDKESSPFATKEELFEHYALKYTLLAGQEGVLDDIAKLGQGLRLVGL